MLYFAELSEPHMSRSGHVHASRKVVVCGKLGSSGGSRCTVSYTARGASKARFRLELRMRWLEQRCSLNAEIVGISWMGLAIKTCGHIDHFWEFNNLNCLTSVGAPVIVPTTLQKFVVFVACKVEIWARVLQRNT